MIFISWITSLWCSWIFLVLLVFYDILLSFPVTLFHWVYIPVSATGPSSMGLVVCMCGCAHFLCSLFRKPKLVFCKWRKGNVEAFWPFSFLEGAFLFPISQVSLKSHCFRSWGSQPTGSATCSSSKGQDSVVLLWGADVTLPLGVYRSLWAQLMLLNADFCLRMGIKFSTSHFHRP